MCSPLNPSRSTIISSGWSHKDDGNFNFILVILVLRWWSNTTKDVIILWGVIMILRRWCKFSDKTIPASCTGYELCSCVDVLFRSKYMYNAVDLLYDLRVWVRLNPHDCWPQAATRDSVRVVDLSRRAATSYDCLNVGQPPPPVQGPPYDPRRHRRHCAAACSTRRSLSERKLRHYSVCTTNKLVKISVLNAVLYLSILIHTYVENNYREMGLLLVNSVRPPKQQQFSGHFSEPTGHSRYFLNIQKHWHILWNELPCFVVLRKVWYISRHRSRYPRHSSPKISSPNIYSYTRLKAYVQTTCMYMCQIYSRNERPMWA